ncbi:MAG: hypothetical protein U0350_08265 [Caldilineaceae bacterium]
MSRQFSKKIMFVLAHLCLTIMLTACPGPATPPPPPTPPGPGNATVLLRFCSWLDTLVNVNVKWEGQLLSASQNMSNVGTDRFYYEESYDSLHLEIPGCDDQQRYSKTLSNYNFNLRPGTWQFLVTTGSSYMTCNQIIQPNRGLTVMFTNGMAGCVVPWIESPNTGETDNSGGKSIKPPMSFEELVLNGYTILTTDWDGDNITESVRRNDYLIGIVKSNTNGESFVSWYAYRWIDHEGTQTGSAWPLAAISGFQRGNYAFGDDRLAGDTYFAGDFDGDGRKDLVVWNRLEQRIAIVKERDGKLMIGAISSDWVNHLGQIGQEGWNLGKDDYISPGKFYGGDERTELLIKSRNGQWIGMIEEYQGKLVLRSIEHDWVNFEGGTGETGWHLRDDILIEGDFDGDGQIDMVILSPDKQWIGLLEVNHTGKLVTLWIGHNWVNSEGGTGNTGWHLRENDHFLVRSRDNGSDEVVVTSGDGKWQGVLFRRNNRLYAGTISRLQ